MISVTHTLGVTAHREFVCSTLCTRWRDAKSHIHNKHQVSQVIMLQGERQTPSHIYTIICLKSVDVRRLQVAILARSPREMSQTDRILPRYFLSRVRVSVRPRIFYTRKNSQTTVGPITDRPRHRPSERCNNLKGILYLHARWRLTSQFTQMVTDDFVGAPKPPQSKRKLSALQRSSQARQRMRRCGSSLTGNLHMRIT